MYKIHIVSFHLIHIQVSLRYMLQLELKLSLHNNNNMTNEKKLINMFSSVMRL